MSDPRNRVPRLARYGLVLVCAAALAAIALTGSASGRPTCSTSGDGMLVRQGQAFQTSVRSWRVLDDGFGRVVRARSAAACITLIPARAALRRATHAALVVSQRRWGDLTAEIRLRTNRQLRLRHPPHPWEVGWILWHYRDNHDFYYILLRPSGWELGKEDPAYPGSQRFLATGDGRVFALRRWHTVTIHQVRNVITVSVGGRRLVRFTDHQRPYLRGRVGLYTEDASVTFEPLAIHAAHAA